MAVSTALPRLPRMTLAEFLEWDNGSDTRYELIDGRPLAMNPPSIPYGSIVGAMVAELRTGFGDACTTAVEAGIVIPGRDDLYYQADIGVQCTPLSDRRWLDAPVVIVEVLSPTTASHDRGRKGFDYRQLPSFRNWFSCPPRPSGLRFGGDLTPDGPLRTSSAAMRYSAFFRRESPSRFRRSTA